MRHFIVLGFPSHSKDDAGEPLHLGMDRGAALEITNTPEAGVARKELYELAVPMLRRQFSSPPTPEKLPAKKSPAKKKEASKTSE